MSNWTQQEDTVLKSGYEIGRPISEIAETLGRTTGAVRGRACYLGISKQRHEEIEKTQLDDAICPYCGQVCFIDGECDCPEARRDRKIQGQIQRAIEAIEEIFGEECKEEGCVPVAAENIEIMSAAAIQIAHYKIHAVSLVLSGGTRAKLTRGTKGTIKVERSETKKNSAEVEE